MDREEINRKFGVTEEQLDAWAEEYENETWDPACFGKVIIGRPPLADEEVRPVTFRLPVSKIAALDARAAREGHARCEVGRLAGDARVFRS